MLWEKNLPDLILLLVANSGGLPSGLWNEQKQNEQHELPQNLLKQISYQPNQNQLLRCELEALALDLKTIFP